VEPSAIAFGILGTEGAVLKMEGDGRFNLVLGGSSTGMSVETTMWQVVAEHVGCHPDDVTVTRGDTTLTPCGGGTQGSRSAVLYGNVTQKVALQVRDKILTIAAHVLEASAADLELADGRACVRGVPEKGLSLGEIGLLACAGHDALPPGMAPGVEAVSRYSPRR
jgi:carbon-monoxide dehydrogenase large subunit